MEVEEIFPTDIIIEIFLRLPAKSLIRFKSVCKFWYMLISHPGFAKEHLQRSLATQSNLYYVFGTPILHIGDFDTFDNAVELNYPFKKPLLGGVSIIGCCNGLLCLWNLDCFNFVVFLLNPITRTHKMIPPLPSRPYHDAHHRDTFMYGFGYSSVLDDYKVVRVFQCFDEEMGLSYDNVMVYCLYTNSWTKVYDGVPIRIKCRRRDGVLVNENLHWINNTELYHPPLPIVSFSLNTNSFGEVPVPELDFHSYYQLHVGVLDGCLCIVINRLYECEILVMKEYGVVESWAKLLRVEKSNEIPNEIERIIGYNRNRKELLVKQCLYRVASIDLENMVLEVVSPVCNPSRRYTGAVCVENLLMLDCLSDLLDSDQEGVENTRGEGGGEEGGTRETDAKHLGRD